MPLLAQIFGGLLTVLGVVLYVLAKEDEHGHKSITALIPAFFGLALAVLGRVAEMDKWRVHAMHGAAVLGVIGLAVPLYRAIQSLAADSGFTLPVVGSLLMAALCGAFTGLCVKSFMDARRRRKQGEASEKQG